MVGSEESESGEEEEDGGFEPEDMEEDKQRHLERESGIAWLNLEQELL